MSPSPGRPRRASQELLQEAAFELFQLRGYRATSVEQIAKTAGFSRATFFNFFSSKAGLFWVETDGLIASLREFLEQHLEADRAEAPPSLHRALHAYAETLTSTSIPWALQHYRLLEAADDLIASGASRVLGLNRLFQDYLERREAMLTSNGGDPAPRSADAAVATALLLSALRAWIDAGVDRGRLSAHLERAFEAVAPR
ncbi:MAG: TetR family transcriptional regulator [Actinobacteria bacterium]|nr:TetR family transcriptional regulator [Actinomycetota bacterium]